MKKTTFLLTKLKGYVLFLMLSQFSNSISAQILENYEISGSNTAVVGQTYQYLVFSSSPVDWWVTPEHPLELTSGTATTIKWRSAGTYTIYCENINGKGSKTIIVTESSENQITWKRNENNIHNTNSGFVGIGVSQPSQKLDVNGTIRLREIYENSLANKVLVTRNDGTIYWKKATSINTDNQAITLIDNSLSIQNANSLDLTKFLDNTDNQDLILTGTLLNLTNDDTPIDLSSFLDNTDAQTLSLSGTSLTISNGNTIQLPSLSGGDNLGNHIATQDIIPNTTNNYSLGNSFASYKDLYLDGMMYKEGSLFMHTNGNIRNFFAGEGAGGIVASASYNTGVGYNALFQSYGNSNSAFGSSALSNNTIGVGNSAIGAFALRSNTTGSYNTAVGMFSLSDNSTGSRNIAIGKESLKSNEKGSDNTAIGFLSLYSNTSGNSNTASGSLALHLNTTGEGNTAMGNTALYSNTTGIQNTAIGIRSLSTNTTGVWNTAIGANSLFENTTGDYNTASGHNALTKNSTGKNNTANGAFSLNDNTIGEGNTSSGYASLAKNIDASGNTANGYFSLTSTTIGGFNTGNGAYAIFLNTEGRFNTSSGFRSMSKNTTGSANTAFGAYAGSNLENLDLTTAIGYASTADALSAVAIGSRSVASGIESIAIGESATATEDYTVVIGNINTVSIGGNVSWSTLSDGRFKTSVKENVSGLDFINALRPVSYEIDTQKLKSFLKINQPEKEFSEKVNFSETHNNNVNSIKKRQTGFIAQEVEALIKEAGYDFNGVKVPTDDNEQYSIRYAEFVVPLVKAVQELSAIAEKQQEQINTLLAEKTKEEFSLQEETNFKNNDVALFQNHPNPFTGNTNIEMILPENTVKAQILIFNLEGKQITSIPVHRRGATTVQLDGGTLEAGMYIYTLIVDGKVVSSKRMILTK